MIGRYSDDEILLLGCHYGARVMFSWQSLRSRDTCHEIMTTVWSGDTTPGMAAKDITQRRIMLWTSYVRPIMFQPWLIQTPTWHHDTHSTGDIIDQSAASIRRSWPIRGFVSGQKRCYVRSVMQLQSSDIPNRENSSQNIDDDCLRGNSFKHTFVIKSFKWPFPHLMNSLPDASQTLDTFSEIFRNYLMFVINVGAGEWLTTLLRSIRGDVTGNAEWQTVTRVM